MADAPKFGSFGMEKMKQKDEEERIKRMNTKQKRGTPTRDVGLQTNVFFWIMEILDEQPKGKQDFDQWISNGVILSKVLQHFMFNSIPMEMTHPERKSSNPTGIVNPKKSINHNVPTPDKATEDRIKSLLWYLRRFGIPEAYLFEVEDLKDMTNIPRVTRTIAMLGKMLELNYLKIVP